MTRLLTAAALAAPAVRPAKPPFESLEHYLFPSAEKAQGGAHTDGVVILREGRVVYERYGNGYNAETPHLVWSVSKSFSNALLGIAVLDGKIRTEDSLCQYFPELNGGDHCAITLNHLLRHTSGLKWVETYEGSGSPAESSVLSMLYGEGRVDMGGFTARHPLEAKPGVLWKYSSGGTNLALGALQRALGEKTFSTYPWKRLFEPLGMKHVTFERDGRGVFIGSSYLYAPPLELAKFGQLFLQDGVWEGKRILPKGWVKYSTTPTDALKNAPPAGVKRSSAGASWWLNIAVPEGKVPAGWPSAPEDTYVASGHWGQAIVVIPSKKLVAVRVGDDRGATFTEDAFIARVLEGIP